MSNGTNGVPGRTQSIRANVQNSHDAEAFTGAGLLANSGFSQGGVGRGHGVMSGNHAKGPMLDMSDGSQFAPGSLLSKVESQHGKDGPIIDREKKIEAKVPTGEGF